MRSKGVLRQHFANEDEQNAFTKLAFFAWRAKFLALHHNRRRSMIAGCSFDCAPACGRLKRAHRPVWLSTFKRASKRNGERADGQVGC